ncbi:MAG: HAD-IIA family hydrolase [Aeromicrobium sp.]
MTNGPNVLATSPVPLHDVHDLAMLDLDGVVYLGPDAIPGAAQALGAARAAGMRLAYLTNNASRPATDVAAHLRDLGMPDLNDDEVVTSAQAVAMLMADDLPAGSPVLLIGGPGLRVPLEERGFRCVASLDDEPVAVVQGYHADLGWRDLAEASYAINTGLPWYASNTDLTIPTPRGVAPGNGALVQAVATATGRTPIVAGKPERALFDATTARLGGERPLMVGDRLDTDIDGAICAGISSLVVLTGVSNLGEVFAASPGRRPDYVSADLSGLCEPHLAVEIDGAQARCGSSTVSIDPAGRIDVTNGGPRATATLRAAVALAWTWADTSGSSATSGGTLDS